MNAYLNAFRNYADFTGRSGRSAYWLFILYNTFFSIVMVMLDYVFNLTFETLGYGVLYAIYALVTFLPALALAVRRLHDTGRSGWMLLIALIPIVGAIWLIVLFALKGHDQENEYGEFAEASDSHSSVTDELIFLYISVALFTTVIYGALPKLIDDFYLSSTFEMARFYLRFITSILPLSLAIVVKNRNKRVFLIILAALIIAQNLYSAIAPLR